MGAGGSAAHTRPAKVPKCVCNNNKQNQHSVNIDAKKKNKCEYMDKWALT